jgi:hypothetical protein
MSKLLELISGEGALRDFRSLAKYFAAPGEATKRPSSRGSRGDGTDRTKKPPPPTPSRLRLEAEADSVRLTPNGAHGPSADEPPTSSHAAVLHTLGSIEIPSGI